MEPTYWARFIQFIRDSYTRRLKQSASGVLMGLVTANNFLFAGGMAEFVGAFWWVIKGLGAVLLAFLTSLATSYAAYLIDSYKEKKSVPGTRTGTKRKRA